MTPTFTAKRLTQFFFRANCQLVRPGLSHSTEQASPFSRPKRSYWRIRTEHLSFFCWQQLFFHHVALPFLDTRALLVLLSALVTTQEFPTALTSFPRGGEYSETTSICAGSFETDCTPFYLQDSLRNQTSWSELEYLILFLRGRIRLVPPIPVRLDTERRVTQRHLPLSA